MFVVPSDVSLELNADSRKIGIQVMAEIYHRVLDGLECYMNRLSIIVQSFIMKGDIKNCSCYGVMKLPGIKMVEMV